MSKLQILDCTLRDGGYYTNWDFDPTLVDDYLRISNTLPIDYLEIGYRNPSITNKYFGEFFHLDEERIASIAGIAKNKKIAIMLDAKAIKPADLNPILSPIKGLVDLVRIAVNPLNYKDAINIGKGIKDAGFNLALNFMYLSKHPITEEILLHLKEVDLEPDFLYLVDSYGGATPEHVKDQITLVRKHFQGAIGFHGHNNLELALINTLAAIDAGATIVDSTVLGMGRGAGNLKTELLLTYLFGTKKVTCDLEALARLTQTFKPLHNLHNWGVNLPYMLSGALNVPQAQVMKWLVSDRYSIDDIVAKVFSLNLKDKQQFEVVNTNSEGKSTALIIGGGISTRSNAAKILKYLDHNPELDVISTSLKVLEDLDPILEKVTFCLSGQQLREVGTIDPEKLHRIKRIVIPPSPRNIEVQVPSTKDVNVYELPEIHFEDPSEDSPLILALELAYRSKYSIELIGFDGYESNSEKGIYLNNLNNTIFNTYQQLGVEISTLTNCSYPLKQASSIHAKTMFL